MNKFESSFKLKIYFTILLFYCIFNPKNAVLVSISDFFKKLFFFLREFPGY